MSLRKLLLALCASLLAFAANAADKPAPTTSYLLKADRVFDARSEHTHAGWAVLVQGDKIAAVGPAAQIKAPSDAQVIDMPGTTLMPGMIDAHSHIFLHPYNETLWNDQVLKEPLPYRTIEAVNHVHDTADGRLYRFARSRHRGRGLRGRGRTARDQPRPDPRSAPVRRHPRHRGEGLLRTGPNGIPRGYRPAAGRHSGRRRARDDRRGARPGRSRRGLDQDLRRLPLRQEPWLSADLHTGRIERGRRGCAFARPSGIGALDHAGRHAPFHRRGRRHHRARVLRHP